MNSYLSTIRRAFAKDSDDLDCLLAFGLVLVPVCVILWVAERVLG